MKGHKSERCSKSKGEGRKSSAKRTSPAESLASSPSEVYESAVRTHASVGAFTEREGELSRTNTNTGTAFQGENRASGEEGHMASTFSSALSSDTTSQTTTAGQRTPNVTSQWLRATNGANVPSTTRPKDTQSLHRAQSVQPHTRHRAAVKAPSVAAGSQKAFSDSDLVALSTTASTIPGDASPSSTRESSPSQSRTFSLRKKKKLKLPGFLRMKGKQHCRHGKHKVPIQTRPTLEEHDGAMGRNKPTDALRSRDSRESGTPIIHSVTPPGKHFEDKTLSRPGTASAFTPVTRPRKKAEAGLPKESASPRGPPSPVSEAGGRDRTTTLSPPLTPTPTSTLLRSPGTSWTSIITRDTSGRTTPRTAAILTMLRRASRDVPSPATVGDDARPPKCLDRLSTVSEIRWACDDDEPQRDASTAVRPGPSPATLATRSRLKRAQRKNVYFSDERDDHDLLRVPDVPLSAAPYNIRSSKLPRFMNLKDTHPGHRYRKSMIAVMVLSPVLIFVFLIAVLLLKQHSGLRRLKMFHITDDLKKGCRNGNKVAAAVSGCVLAVEQMSYAMDWFADPCTELDQFVCGRWRSWNPYRGTYRQESAENMTAVIDESLLYILGNLHLYGHEEGSMAVFYNSCRSFFVSHCGRMVSAGDVISALGLQHRLGATNETAGTQGLLDFVVATSMETGLSSVISVSSRAGRVYVDVGQSLQSTLNNANVVLFLTATLSELDVGNETVTPFLYLDHAIHSCVAEADTTQPFQNVALGMLGEGSFGDSFVEALNQAGSPDAPEYSAESPVAVRCLSEIRATLATLASASLHRAYVYSAMVLLAQVMKYAYIFQCGGDDAQQVTKNCVKITGQHFRTLFPPWVAKKVLGGAALGAFHAMAKTLRQAVVRSATAKELNVTDSDFKDIKVVVVGESTTENWPPSTWVTDASSHYDDRFLLNVVRASHDAVDVDYDEHAVERQLGGRVVVEDLEDRLVVLVPADFLTADMMYASSGPEINLPTIGVWLLVQWIRAAIVTKAVRQTAAYSVEEYPQGNAFTGQKVRAQVRTGSTGRGPLLSEMPRSRKIVSNRVLAVHRGGTLSARGGRTTGSGISDGASSSLRLVSEDFHSDLAAAVSGKVECLRQEASGALGRNVSVEEAESLFFVDWAVEAAMSATAAERRGSAESWWWLGHRRVAQMFFMRFCHSICGDEEMADACRFQVVRHLELALAFRCPVAQAVSCSS